VSDLKETSSTSREPNQSAAAAKASAEQMQWRFVLASSSPRRHELIKYLGLDFEIVPSEFEEIVHPHMSPEEVVLGLAKEKALEVYRRVKEDQPKHRLMVLGADTIVALDGEILGKPSDVAHACEMLKKLSGRCHVVHTGVTVVCAPADNGEEPVIHQVSDTSRVHIREISDDEIAYYVDTKEPMDKAGSYALQGIGSAFVEKIDGCFTNIIGLPVPKVVALLRRAGVVVMSRAVG
jgi:septum formation protein